MSEIRDFKSKFKCQDGHITDEHAIAIELYNVQCILKSQMIRAFPPPDGFEYYCSRPAAVPTLRDELIKAGWCVQIYSHTFIAIGTSHDEIRERMRSMSTLEPTFVSP